MGEAILVDFLLQENNNQCIYFSFYSQIKKNTPARIAKVRTTALLLNQQKNTFKTIMLSLINFIIFKNSIIYSHISLTPVIIFYFYYNKLNKKDYEFFYFFLFFN